MISNLNNSGLTFDPIEEFRSCATYPIETPVSMDTLDTAIKEGTLVGVYQTFATGRFYALISDPGAMKPGEESDFKIWFSKGTTKEMLNKAGLNVRPSLMEFIDTIPIPT